MELPCNKCNRRCPYHPEFFRCPLCREWALEVNKIIAEEDEDEDEDEA